MTSVKHFIMLSIILLTINSKLIMMNDKDLQGLLSNKKTQLKVKKSHKKSTKHFNDMTKNWNPQDIIGRQYNKKDKTLSNVWLVRCHGDHGMVWGKGTENSSTYVIESDEKELQCHENTSLVMKNLRVIHFDNSEEHPCPEFSITRKCSEGFDVRWVPVIIDSYYGEMPGKVQLDDYNFAVNEYADYPYGDFKQNSRIINYLCPALLQ